MSTQAVPPIDRDSTKSKAIEIFVNARPFDVPDRDVTFEEVVALAFPNQAPGVDTEYVVTYTRAQHGNGSGSLAPGQRIRVKKGTSFGVQTTTRS